MSVNQVNPGYSSGREKFDWVVLGLKIVVEVHGEQHYRPVCFGGITRSEAEKNFEKRVRVDKEKQDAAEQAGWAYLVVKYTEKRINVEELGERINQAISDATPAQEIKPAKPKARIQSAGFRKDGPKQKIASRGFGKPAEGHKWPKRKLRS